MPHRGYIDRKKENVIFTLLYLSDPLSDCNQIATELPASQGSLHIKFEGNCSSHFRDTSCQSFDFFLHFFLLGFYFFVFSHNCKNRHKKQTRTLIALKFGTQKGSPKSNPCIKFGANPINGSGVMTDYSSKTRSICCHAYRVNYSMEWIENCYLDGVTIVGVPFGSLKGIEKKIMEI